MWLFRKEIPPTPVCDYSALTAYQPTETERQAAKGLSDLETYNLYRDYMKHEDSLLASRLASFLTMNTFLIGASVVILGGMLQILSKSPPNSGLVLFIVALGAVVHTMIAVIGSASAAMTASSIQAATDSLAILRDKGNHKLAAAISRGDLPFLSNARGLSPDERSALDQGSGIMRGIPAIMERMWIVVALVPLPIVGAMIGGMLGWLSWVPAH